MIGEFTPQRRNHHVEAVRVVLQPPIDVKDDRVHLQEFFNRVSERQPQLFDTLAQQPGAFEIKKQLSIPGAGRLEVATFFLTPQGPVVSFPRRLPFMHDEVPWSDSLNSDIVKSLNILLECHPGRKFLQLTKRRESIYTTETHNSNAYVRERFATGVPPDTQDIGVRWTDSDNIYDRRVSVSAVQRSNVMVQRIGGVQVQREEPTEEFGIKVVVEVSNRRAGGSLDAEQAQIILDHADSYYNERVVQALEGTGDGERE